MMLTRGLRRAALAAAALLASAGPATAAGASASATSAAPGGLHIAARTAAQDLGASAAAARSALTAGMSASGIPCGSVAVVTVADIMSAGVGRCGAGDVTGDTPFVIGSTSKSFTALAVLQLVDDGRVDLDAPVRRYVPAFTMGDVRVNQMTVRQVLQHTSGLTDLAGGPNLKSAADGTAQQALQELRTARLTAAPGTRWEYANANYVLAGLVVQAASGIAYADFVERRIFQPLGMRHSYTDPTAATHDGLAHGTQFWFGVPRTAAPVVRPGLLAAGYLMSSAHDLGRYMQMYLRGGVSQDGTRIVTERSLHILMSPGPTTTLGPWAHGASARYAMGWFVGGPWSTPLTFHPGNSPDTSAMLAVSPSTGRAVVTLVAASNELPVPGNPSAIDGVSAGAVAAAFGETSRARPSVRALYRGFDLVVLLVLTALGLDLARAVRAARRHRPPVRRMIAWAGASTRLLVAVALTALPVLVGYGWPAAWTWAPDLALATAAAAALLGAAGSVCAAAAWRSPRRGAQGPDRG